MQHAVPAILARTRSFLAQHTVPCVKWASTQAWKLRSTSPLASSVQPTPPLCSQRVQTFVIVFVVKDLQETLPTVSPVLDALSGPSRADLGLLPVNCADQELTLVFLVKDVVIYVRRAHTTRTQAVTRAWPARDVLRSCLILSAGTCIPSRGLPR